MTSLKIVQSADADYPLQCRLRGGVTPATFAAGDTLDAYVYRGQTQEALFNPIVAWYTAGGQTGYGQGQVLVSIGAADSATLEAGGNYTLQVWWTSASADRTAPIWRGFLSVIPAAGAATQLIAPYNSYQDMLDVAGWVQMIQNSDADQEGFYAQRLQARTWMDAAIIANYRGGGVGVLGRQSEMAFAFGGGYGLAPSQPMIDYLAADKLILRPSVVKACAHWAVSLVGVVQIGSNNAYAQYGMYHQAMAERVASSIIAEIDTSGSGQGSIFVPLGVTATVFS